MDGPNWILIAGGALLSTLSIRLGYKLRQASDDSDTTASSRRSRSRSHRRGEEDPKDEEATSAFVPAENGVIWATSPDRLELAPNGHRIPATMGFGSPCASDSGGSADLFTKRDAILKLRQQLRRRDEMISEMQDRIAELQAQLGRSAHLEAQLEEANRDAFESEREVQRLRKAIADHCVGGSEGEKVEMLRRELGELKEVLQGKDYLLHSYKEHKAELSLKVAELQSRLADSASSHHPLLNVS